MTKKVSIKKNFLYNSVLTTANYLFTFITYPYVSRVLGVDRIGTVNFIDSVINYFIMLSMLGIYIVGVREIAKSKDDKPLLNRTFSSLFFLNLGFTAFALIALGIAYLCMPSLQANGELMLVGVFKLLANLFLMDWFFNGIENFKIITIRTFIIRSFCAIATFIFIQEPSDYIKYFLLITIAIAANAMVNCIYLSKFVRLTTKGLKLKAFLAPVLILGLYMFFGNFYSSFNTMFLGVKCGDTEVGYFSTATKLYTLFLSLFTAFTSVMMPRTSSLLKEGKLDEYHNLFSKSVTILLAFCLPLVLLTTSQSANIIMIISGEGYEGAVVPMIICMPLLIIIGYNQILMNQGLMPLGKDKAILTSSACGGCVALVLCFVLIPAFHSIGSSILWLASELTVNMVASAFIYKYTDISYPLKRLLVSIAFHLPLLSILVITRTITGNPIIDLSIASAVTFLYCFVLQCFLLRDETVRGIFQLNKHIKL